MQGCGTYLGQLEEQAPSSAQVRFAIFLLCRFLNQHICASSLLSQAQEVLPALHCIRHCNIDDPELEKALFLVYVMVVEHDVLNYRHLENAGPLALLKKYITECLHRGPNVWPTEDTCNVVAFALFWHMTLQGASR